jgi:hypothetical protein
LWKPGNAYPVTFEVPEFKLDYSESLTEEEESEFENLNIEETNNLNPSPEVNIDKFINEFHLNFNPEFKFKFSGKIDFNPKFVYKPEYKIYIIKKVLVEHYYFDPKYYNFDVSKRILYTIDRHILLKLNFNFILINEEYLYFILSVLQLNLLGIIENDRCSKYLEIISKLISAELRLKYEYRKASFIKFVRGKEIERIECELTSKEFDAEIRAQIARMNVRFYEGQFYKDTT